MESRGQKPEPSRVCSSQEPRLEAAATPPRPGAFSSSLQQPPCEPQEPSSTQRDKSAGAATTTLQQAHPDRGKTRAENLLEHTDRCGCSVVAAARCPRKGQTDLGQAVTQLSCPEGEQGGCPPPRDGLRAGGPREQGPRKTMGKLPWNGRGAHLPQTCVGLAAAGRAHSGHTQARVPGAADLGPCT